MISWVVKGSLEVSRVAESAHLFCDCGWEKLEVPWTLTEPDFHTVVRRFSDQRVCREHADILARVRPELSAFKNQNGQRLEER